MTSLPALPARAAYLYINNAPRRNALSLATLRDLRAQLIKANTCQKTGRLLLLPPFKPELLSALEQCAEANSTSPPSPQTPSPEDDHTWLLSSRAFAAARANLPAVLVLASSGPVFSAGHDLRELRTLPAADVRDTFALCAEVMALIRRSPAPVVARVQGLATAAGAQLALTADLPIAAQGVQFRLPGAALGLPCTSPSVAVSRRVGRARGFRMMALAEGWDASELGGAVEVVGGGPEAFDSRVQEVVAGLAGMPAQPAALGKWAYWTQAGLQGQDWIGPVEGGGAGIKEGSGGDGYEDAVVWAGRMMALYARSSEDAREGMTAFMEKRKPVWVSNGEGAGDAAEEWELVKSKL